MATPINALVAEMVERLTDTLKEDFEERAAMMEFDGGLSKAHAECLALLDVLLRYPLALAGIAVLCVELEEATEWILTTDIKTTRSRLQAMQAIVVEEADLLDVVESQYDGIAVLSTPDF